LSIMPAMRPPFLIVLLAVGVIAFALDVWLGIGLVLVFGRALLTGAHRRPAFGSSSRSVRSGAAAPAAVDQAAGPDGDGGLLDWLPLP
jgi:hypothetical protein